MKIRRLLLAAALVAVPALVLPAAGVAASATVTGDAGTPVPLIPAPSIRNMDPEVAIAFDPSEKRYSAVVTGPGGAQASTGTDCDAVGAATPELVEYQGNGTYTVTVRTSPDETDFDCTDGGAPQVFTFTINAFTAVAAPGSPLLTRGPGDTSLASYPFQVELNPNADQTELFFARGAGIGADGGLTVPGRQASVSPTTGAASVSFDKPGTYTFVARATEFGTVGGSSPWSAPVQVKVLAPFDFIGEPTFADSRGPAYRITGVVREPTAEGKIRVSLAKGTKQGAFHRLRSVRIAKNGRFAVRFTIRRPGKYRLKYTYGGSQTVAGGFVVQGIRIQRTFVFV